MAADHFRDTISCTVASAKQPKGEVAVSGKRSKDKRRLKGKVSYFKHSGQKDQKEKTDKGELLVSPGNRMADDTGYIKAWVSLIRFCDRFFERDLPE